MSELKKWYWAGEKGMSDTLQSGTALGVNVYYEGIDVDNYYCDLIVEKEKRINELLTVIETANNVLNVFYTREKQKAGDKKKTCAGCGKEMAVEGVMYYCEECDDRLLTDREKEAFANPGPVMKDGEIGSAEVTEPAWKAIRQYINDANDPLLHDFAKALIWLKERADDERSRIILLDERIVHLEEKAKELEGDMR